MQKGARPKERTAAGSRPESGMEVDEAPRSKRRLNLDRAAQEHMNEGLEVWRIPTESTSSLHGLETQPIRPLMDVALPGYTPSSTRSSSQVSGSSSRLKELNERLQLRSRESPARVELPPTWREQPIRSVVISSYKKNTEGRYHRHNRMDWSTAQRVRRDCFHDAACVEYHTHSRVPEGAVHLIIGDSLLRVLIRIQAHWQTEILSFAGAAMPQILASLEMLGMTRVYTVTLMIETNDVSRGESRKVMRLHDKMSCILEELRIQVDPAILTVCTVPYNMMAYQHAMEMNTKVRNLNEVIRQLHQRSVFPVGLLDVAEQMQRAAFPDNASSYGIHFDRPRGVEWLNDVFQRHISALEAELLETAQFTFGPPPNPPFLASRTLSSRLEARLDSTDSSRSSRTRLPGPAPMEAEEATSSTPQSSVVSSVVVVESKRVERPAETSRSRYLEKVKELDLEDLECKQELAEALGLERVSHEELSRDQCVDWLKAHETHFSRARIMETADLTGNPTRSVMGPINYRPLKLLGNPGLIVEPPKHQTSLTRIKLATPAQLKVVDKLLDPREMELPDAAYEGTRLADDPRYGNPCGNDQLAKTLAVYDRADPAAEISNFARQLKFSPAIGDDHPIINHLTASLWFRSMDLTITSSTSKSRGPSNERKNVAATEKQLESMVYRLTQERGRWPFLTPRLENATEKTKENAPPLVKHIWSFLEVQLEVAESREITVTRFVTAANEVTIGGFWREHAKKKSRDSQVLESL